jgi:hypothetical protein
MRMLISVEARRSRWGKIIQSLDKTHKVYFVNLLRTTLWLVEHFFKYITYIAEGGVT